MSKERDHSFEMLASVCGITIVSLPASARGALNRALGEIRGALPDLQDEELAMVIEGKARMYRRVMPDAMLTPTALAKHWPQLESLVVEQDRVAQRVNGPIDPSDCTTCGGDRMILKHLTPIRPSAWQLAHRNKIHPTLGQPHPAHDGPTAGHEAWSPCPDCNGSALAIAHDYRDRFDRIHATKNEPPAGAVAALKDTVGA